MKRNTVFTYPDTEQDPVVDVYFGTEVTDPYRWLEDDMSAATGAWVDAQNAVTFAYLDTLPQKQAFAKSSARLWIMSVRARRSTKASTPTSGEILVCKTKRSSIASMLRVKKTSLLIPTPSPRKVRPLLLRCRFPSQVIWRPIKRVRAARIGAVSRLLIPNPSVIDQIDDVKFSGLAWQGEQGFYYSRYESPEGNELTAKTDHHRLYFHELGTPQSADRVVFGDGVDENTDTFLSTLPKTSNFWWSMRVIPRREIACLQKT